MPSRTIEINEKTFNRLLQHKRENEEITEVIERLLGPERTEQDIMKFFGIWKDLPEEFFKIMESAHREIRDELNKRFL